MKCREELCDEKVRLISEYSIGKLRQSHGNTGPRSQAHAGNGMNQKQRKHLPGAALLSSKATRAEPVTHPPMAWPLLHMGGEVPLLTLKSLKRKPVSENSAIRWEISLNKPFWTSGKDTNQLSTKRRLWLPQAVCAEGCQPH